MRLIPRSTLARLTVVLALAAGTAAAVATHAQAAASAGQPP